MILDAKRVAIAAALMLLATGSWWLTHKVSAPETSFNGKARHDPDYTIENFNATAMNEQGRRRYVLAADLLVHYGDDGSSELTQPYLIQYREGLAPVHTRAEKGWMPKDGREILMRGNVVSAQGTGGEIHTDSMKILLDK